MYYVILAFGLFLIFVGTIILANPNIVYTQLRNHSNSLNLHIAAVVARILLGVVLIRYADESKFPLAFEIIGYVSLIAGITLGGIGRIKFLKLMQWALTLVPKYGRVTGLLAIVFGGFLWYAVL